ncbi:unnamed protein product [Ectocarpus sp. 6 AP-2014]
MRHPDSESRVIWGLRDVHVIVSMIFACTLACYFERMGFSIAFTELAKSASLNEADKGTVMSAFYYGYTVMQLPGGWLSARHGGARILGLSFALWGSISMVMPGTVHDGSTTILIACRVAIGASQGLFIPASHTLLAKWIPVHERSRLVTLAMSGMYLGSALAMLFVPYIAEEFGPGMQFQVSGLMALVWLTTWWRVGSDQPPESGCGGSSSSGSHSPARVEEGSMEAMPPFNKKEDPMPLLHSHGSHSTSSGAIGGAGGGGGRDSKHGRGCGKGDGGTGVPWGILIQSPAVWAIVTNNFAFHYATYVLMNWLPTYFQDHIGVGLSDMSNWYTVMPYVMMFLASNAGGSLFAWAHVSLGRSIVFSRKFVNTLGFSLAPLSLLLMPRATHWRDGVLYTTMALSALGLSRGGWAVNHMDIAPRHAGVVMAIANGAGTLAGIVGVSWTGKMLEAMGGPTEAVAWTVALGVVAFICVSALVTFLLLARGNTLFH